MATMTANNIPGYTDPYPGLKGTDRVKKTCGRCGGVGNVRYGNVKSADIVVGAAVAGACFDCAGLGYYTILVSTARATARKQAKEAAARAAQEAQWESERPVREWLEAEAKWKSNVEAWLAEEARVASMTQGFVAEIGDTIRNLTGTVTVAHTFETASYTGYGTTNKALVVIELDNGQFVKTVSTARAAFQVERGDKVTIVRATVIKHDNYDGQDQTVVNRIKLEQI